MSDLIDIHVVAQRFSVSRSTVYRMIDDGLAPRAVRVCKRAVRWPSDEINAVVNARVAGKSVEQIRYLVRNLTKQRAEKDNPPTAA